MDAIREIEAALAAGPTEGEWHSPGMGEIHAADHRSVADVLFPQDDEQKEQYVGNQKDADYIAACNPAAIREVLQTLASKEAENARLRAALADARTYVEASSLNASGPKTRQNYRQCVARIEAALINYIQSKETS